MFLINFQFLSLDIFEFPDLVLCLSFGFSNVASLLLQSDIFI